MEGIGPGLALAIILFGLVMTIVWIIVPFAIIGTKPILRQLLEQQIRTNKLLTEVQRRQLAVGMPELGGPAEAPSNQPAQARAELL